MHDLHSSLEICINSFNALFTCSSADLDFLDIIASKLGHVIPLFACLCALTLFFSAISFLTLESLLESAAATLENTLNAPVSLGRDIEKLPFNLKSGQCNLIINAQYINTGVQI